MNNVGGSNNYGHISTKALEYFQNLGCKTMLDIGCGVGLNVSYASEVLGYDAWGIEGDPKCKPIVENFVLHDFENNQFIVEWSDMRTYQFNDEQDFQIILKPIANNDGEIKINYKTFNNTSYSDHHSQTPIHGQFSTVGIENLNQSDGLEYSYNNFYSPGSGEISDEFSILITKFYDPYDYTVGDLNFDGNINVSDIVYMVSIIMNYIESDQYLDELGDINNDHQLNVSDIVMLVYIILND